MSLLDRARSLFSSPADRRLRMAAEAWQTAPKPSTALALASPTSMQTAPAGGAGQPPAKSPPINWTQDQPPPAPQHFHFLPGYSDHVYEQFSAPLAFEGWSLDRIRNAVASHRLGYFLETSALMVAILGFAPVLAALQQAIAPILALPRHVHGGDRGLSKLVAGDVRQMLVPASGLLPSPYLPPQLWGTMAIYLRIMGFCVLQHVDGEPDPETQVRMRYTRIWEPWAVNRYRSPRKAIAMTTRGPVEICNDGKFTMVEDEQEGHLSAAICALGEETLAGKISQDMRLSWLDFFGKPKLIGYMPEKVAVDSEAGRAFQAALSVIFGPDGHGVAPYGSKLEAVSISGEGAKAFQDAVLDHIIHIYMVLTGSAGTIGSGSATGAGPYQPQKGGPWSVRHDLIARPTIAIVRGVNQGHVAPYCEQNYAEAIARAKRVGAWVEPTLEIPIPAPDRDERIKSEIERYKALSEQVKGEREAGAIVDQDRVDKLAGAFEVKPFVLADRDPKVGEIYEYHITNKQVATDEVRDRLGFDPLPDGAGSVEQLAEERKRGSDKTGAVKQAPAEPPSPPQLP